MAKKRSPAPQTPSTTPRATFLSRFSWYLVLMPLLTLLWGWVYFEKGEIIALNKGCGWDGVTYKNVVWSLQWNKARPDYAERSRLRIDPYRVQRIAPSVAVYGEMQAARWLYQQVTPMFTRVPAWLEWSYEQYPLPPWFFRWFADNPNQAANAQSVALTLDSLVAGYFVFHSLLMLLGTALLWAMTARKLNLGLTARWLGFCGLFANVAVMKMSFYYPTLTDTTALFAAMLMLYAYVANSAWLLLPAAVLGFFTFPTAFYVAALLFLFPRSIVLHKEAVVEEAQAMTGFERNAGIGAGVLVLCASVYFVLIAEVRFVEVEQIQPMLLILTLPLLLAHVFFTVSGLAAQFPLQAMVRHFKERKNLAGYALRALILLVLWAGLLYWKKQIEDPTLAAPMNTSLFFGGSFASALGKPLLPVVAGAVYFGPIILVMILRFREFLKAAWNLGLGYMLVVTGLLLMGIIMSETRQLINFLPFLVLGVAYSLDSIRLPRIALVLFALVSVIAAKVWLPFNFAGMAEQAANITGGIHATFPLQYYFMNHGPWMSWTSYFLQGACALVVAGLLWWVLSPTFAAEYGEK
ncbi:MAG: hypothetical protein EAZ92_12095 [Candidatus Kapaibacterium sp.]|nr:MAG: hypothetical protein EAZ92_12095 [Candidatus Kapabacteria bacterium]